jgi:hypothetical protein
LDAYVGQTIQLVFYYEGVVVDTTVYGWTLDDFSITGTAGGGGTITVSKNLGQGSFTLTGPLSETTGTAPSTTFSNLPAGLYTVQFSDVAFYQTPPDQSNTLTDGGTLTFPGNYTFIDLNSNGISDAWEDYYFGSAPTNRTPSTDTDGSGLSDYGKFMAGLNPTNPASQFIFLSTTLETNHTVLLEWSALPGRLYQVESSSNLVSWTPVTGWLQAAGSPMSFAATNANAHAGLFRVQVRP